MKTPKVYRGAGPGDPGLITVKGRECIASADVIYDYLAAPPAAARFPEAELIYVGEKAATTPPPRMRSTP
jgi:uroporphyrinogen III methyltransferase/synthase